VCSDDSSSSPVKQLLECVPAAVKQHAVRGRACILKQQGDCEDAKALLSELVQSKQQFADVQHLAQADYGALLHEQGKLKVCAGLLCITVPHSCPTKPRRYSGLSAAGGGAIDQGCPHYLIDLTADLTIDLTT
jgi:hypothetical protein